MQARIKKISFESDYKGEIGNVYTIKSETDASYFLEVTATKVIIVPKDDCEVIKEITLTPVKEIKPTASPQDLNRIPFDLEF